MPTKDRFDEVIAAIDVMGRRLDSHEGRFDEVITAIAVIGNRLDNHENRFDEILGSIHAFSESVDQRFDAVDKRFELVDRRFDSIDKRFDRIEGRVDSVEGKVGRIGASMVTKDYLDEKMADMKGDLVLMTRKEDGKVVALVEELESREVIDHRAAKRILGMGPFPRA